VEVAKVTSKGQITIPISIRRKLEINEGDKVLFIYKPDGVMMVNPNALQGGETGDVVEAAETEMAAEAIAALKERSAKSTPAASTVQSEDSPSAAEDFNEQELKEDIAAAAAGAPAQQETQRPVPPPIEEPAPPDKHISGLNLGTLLDDIRSIGSNI